MGKGGSVSVKEMPAMDGDTPVNTGVVTWPEFDSAWLTVRRMQLKLHRWASEEPARRFDDLFNLVYDPAFLMHAWERVRSNKGARTAGVDGHTAAQIEARVGVNVFLGQIRDALKSGAYRPSPARQVKIPKGGGKLRTLGIPTVTDRVVQAACTAVLEPIFEADFLPCSYGFRPNRRAQDAIAEIHHFTSRPCNYHWVLEADIAACFDEIDHVAGMDRVRARIKDKRLCAVVKAFLKAGVLNEFGNREETLTGTPQGGILSPLLANIALSALDEYFTQQWDREMGNSSQRRKRRNNGMGNWRLVRYADDFVLMVSGERHHAEALRTQVAAVLTPLGLRLAPEKTRVVHVDEGFDFLGFHIRRMRKRGTDKQYVYTTPSRKAVQKARDKGRVKTYRSTQNRDLDEVIDSLNKSLRGWANYFRHGVSKATFKSLDNHAWLRLANWIRRKYRLSCRKALRLAPAHPASR
jgi:RNA-directed DNA polymerase